MSAVDRSIHAHSGAYSSRCQGRVPENKPLVIGCQDLELGKVDERTAKLLRARDRLRPTPIQNPHHSLILTLFTSLTVQRGQLHSSIFTTTLIQSLKTRVPSPRKLTTVNSPASSDSSQSSAQRIVSRIISTQAILTVD